MLLRLLSLGAPRAVRDHPRIEVKGLPQMPFGGSDVKNSDCSIFIIYESGDCLMIKYRNEAVIAESAYNEQPGAAYNGVFGAADGDSAAVGDASGTGTERGGRRVIGILSGERAIARKLELALSKDYTTVYLGSDAPQAGELDILIADMREGYTDADALGALKDYRGAVIYISAERTASEASLPYPFSFAMLRKIISDALSRKEAPGRRLVIEGDGRHIRLDGERIKLSESEHRLLSAIAEGGGELVERDVLRLAAFGKDGDGSMLNVYIHYLREKLERSGERLIISSRRGGYKIDKKYLGGAD